MARRSLLHDYFQAGIVAIIIALFVRTYLVQAFQIPSPSMEKSILVGDHVLVNKFVYGGFLTPAGKDLLPFSEVKRLDVIVFKFPSAPEKDYVKRVIGLPGDTLQIEDGKVKLKRPQDDGFSVLPEAFAFHSDPPGAPDPDHLRNMDPVVVPEDHYFVMGDNRDDSRDSREWGFVHRNLIRGKVLLVYWSVDFPPPAVGRAESLWQSASATFTRTRWDRTFRIIR